MKRVGSIFAFAAIGSLACGNTVTTTGGGGTASATSATNATNATSGTTTGAMTASSGTTGKTSAATSSQSSTSTGMKMQFGDCNSDSDCASQPNGKCIEVAPGGFRLCQYPVAEATMCTGTNDQCCTSAMCTAPAKCYAGPIVPICAGVVMQPRNECASDQCATNADCPSGVCMKANTIGNKVATCLSSSCTKDTDCTAMPGGYCATVREPCCNTTTGLRCIYPGNCRDSKDCPAGHYCAANQNGGPTCQPGGPICPG